MFLDAFTYGLFVLLSAFNCVLNGLILDETGFNNLYIQPAAGDAGLAIGASLFVYHHVLGNPRKFVMNHSYWGPEYSNDQIYDVLKDSGSKYSTKDEVYSTLHDFNKVSRNVFNIRHSVSFDFCSK